MTAERPCPYYVLEDGALEVLEDCTRNMQPPCEDSQIVLGSAFEGATFPIGSEPSGNLFSGPFGDPFSNPPEEPFELFSGALEPLGFWDLGYSAPE